MPSASFVLEIVDEFENLGRRDANGATEFGQSSLNALAEGIELGGIHGVHGGLELTLMGEQTCHFGVDEAGDILRVVRLIGLPQQQRLRAMWR